jgi:hypothetical protein
MPDHNMDITLGEVYRLVQRVLEQTTKTNGRLDVAEDEIIALKAEIVALKLRQPQRSGSNPAVTSMEGSDLEMNAKRLSAYIAGGLIASWGAVKLIWMLGDWLQKAGLR